MGELKFGELLRYLSSGGAGLLILSLGLKEIGQYFTGSSSTSELSVVGIAFLIGAVSYAIFRALFYVPLYYIAVRISGRMESLNDLDMERWLNRLKSGSLQHQLDEWAAQIHFLYTTSMIGVFGLYFGSRIELTPTPFFTKCLIFCGILFAFGFISAVRFQFREIRVFEHDKALN